MCPDLENPDQLEQNAGQTYLMLPSECKLSLDCEFLQVINFNGTIVLVKMPSIIDPMSNQPAKPDGTLVPSNGTPTPDNLMGGQVGDLNITISSEIDGLKHKDLELANVLIAKIKPKTV